MASPGCAWIGSTGTRLFPLTPALSLGERENRAPLPGEPNALGRAGVSALNRGAYCASGNDARLNKDAGCCFPLPEGEGEGEGERDAANPNGWTNFASSGRPAPRASNVRRHHEVSVVEFIGSSQAHWSFERYHPPQTSSPRRGENASPTSEASLSFCRLSCGFISIGWKATAQPRWSRPRPPRAVLAPKDCSGNFDAGKIRG